MKIIHEKYKSTKKILDPEITAFQSSFESALEYNKDLVNLVHKAQVQMITFCNCALIVKVMNMCHSLSILLAD